MDWSAFTKTQHQLKRPLLVVSGSKGVLACGYVNVGTLEKLNEAGAIVTGVSSFEDMLDATIIEASSAANALGVAAGMSGREALELFR